jgi:3-mercaptopyruvate sulfurtransferase SseA
LAKMIMKKYKTTSNLQVCHGSYFTVDSKWLAANLYNFDLIIFDARGSMLYRFGHIKNARPLGIEMVIMLGDNGANLVIESAAAEKVFGGLGIDDSKKVIVYGEQDDDPSSARIARSIIYHGHTDVKMLDIGFLSGVAQRGAASHTRHTANNAGTVQVKAAQ